VEYSERAAVRGKKMTIDGLPSLRGNHGLKRTNISTELGKGEKRDMVGGGGVGLKLNTS